MNDLSGKKLSEMSLEELWQLFPIFLTEHNDKWYEYYTEMEKVLKENLSAFSVVRIEHIGSTSLHTIWAKPIIDILVELDADQNMDPVSEKILTCGFIKMNGSEKRMTFNYGYTENGFSQRVYHLHLRYKGDNDELYFRDYLIDNPEIAQKYESMKLRLWHQYEHNRDAYTYAKTDFIKKYTPGKTGLWSEVLQPKNQYLSA